MCERISKISFLLPIDRVLRLFITTQRSRRKTRTIDRHVDRCSSRRFFLIPWFFLSFSNSSRLQTKQTTRLECGVTFIFRRHLPILNHHVVIITYSIFQWNRDMIPHQAYRRLHHRRRLRLLNILSIRLVYARYSSTRRETVFIYSLFKAD